MTISLQDASDRAALAEDLARRIGAESLSIRAASKPAERTLQDRWQLEVDVTGGPRTGAHTWALRLDDGRLPLSLDRESETKVVAALYASGAKVAEPIAVAGASDAIPAPYILQAWIDGTASAITPDADLVGALAAELIHIHAIAAPRPELSALPVPLESPAKAEAARLRAALANATEPRPALEYCLAWLDTHAPPARPLALVHGNVHAENVMVNHGRIAAISGWELAHWGDPDEDLGAFAAQCTRNGNDTPLAAFLDAYATTSGRRPTPDAVRYWRIMAAAKQATIAVLQGDRFRRGETRLELALIGLTPAEWEHIALTDILAWGRAPKGGPRWP